MLRESAAEAVVLGCVNTPVFAKEKHSLLRPRLQVEFSKNGAQEFRAEEQASVLQNCSSSNSEGHSTPPCRGVTSARQLRSATTHHSFRGSFSAVSTPIFATKYSFCSIFQDLQNMIKYAHFCVTPNWKKVRCRFKISDSGENQQTFATHLPTSARFWHHFS